MKKAAILLFALAGMLMFGCGEALGQEWKDYTDRVGGAACDDAQWWTVTPVNGSLGSAVLQCDTWSSRGSKDGSNMTPPFMEYWKESGNGEYALLPPAEIRHLTVKGLPKGSYRLTMLVRVYVENKLSYGYASGVYAIANGVKSHDLASGLEEIDEVGWESDGRHTSYGNGYYHAETVDLQFEVGDAGTLDFGFNTTDYCYTTDVNWVAWKDVHLYYYSTGEEPQPVTTELKSGDYCLRNVASGLYLGAGGKWGVQATLLPHATLLSLSKLGDNTYRITTPYENPNNGLNSLGMSAGTLYMECNADTWTIVPVEGAEGRYTISSASGSCLGYDGSQAVATSMSTADGEAVEWQLLTRKQMVEELLSQQQTDATFLISNPRLDRNSQKEVWEGDGWGHGGYDGEYGNGNYCGEVWNANFDVYQTLSGLPNGRYRLQAQAYYRYNNDWGSNTNYNAYVAHTEGNEPLYAELYANGGSGDVSQPLQSIASERDRIAEVGVWVNQGNDGYGMPFSMSEAANCFSAGLYADNQLEVQVSNHELTIGVRKQQQDGCDWTIWDNFQLTLLELGDNTGFTIEEETPVEDIPFDQASRKNPVDCTSLIQNADFAKAAGWSGNPKITGPASERVVSMGHKEGRNTFDISQTLTGLPDGFYRVTLKGFYRYGDVEWEEHRSYGSESDPNNENNANNVYATYTIPYATISRRIGQERLLAKLYANNSEVGLKSIFAEAHAEATHTDDQQTELGYVPGSAWGASEAFAANEYQVELEVPVIGGELRLGVRKQLGYKYDWACFTDMRLYYLGTDNLQYASGLSVSPSSVSLTVNERRQLSARLGSYASDRTLSWSSSNTSIVTVDQTGMLTAQGNTGSATITVRALGSQNQAEVQTVDVTVTASSGDPSQLVINELQVSNLDMFLDPSFNYGGWVELWNPTSQGISLRNLYVSDDASNLLKFRLNSQAGAVPPGGYGLIWFDHNSECSANVDFKLDMDGGTIYLSDASGQLLTSCTYPPALTRTSYTRVDDGASQWAVTPEPSPGRENGHCPLYDVNIQRVAKPRLVSKPVEQSCSVFGIRIACDGENPADVVIRCRSGNPYYGSAQPANETLTYNASTGLFETNFYSIYPGNVVIIQAFVDGKMPSVPLKLHCINENEFEVLDVSSMPLGTGLPVLSITGDPQHFYGDSLGVFVTGVNGVSGSGLDFPCNWNRDWERPVLVDYYYDDGRLAFSQECSLERFGGWSRSWYPYNFKLKAQKQFNGKNYFEFPFFSDNKPHLKHKTLQVRNGGNDVRCRIKDAALQNIILSSGFYVDCQDYQPVCVYINGEYIGMLNLREPSNKHYALANYGIDTDEQDQLEVTGGVAVKAGTADSFWQWYNLAASASDDATYQQICQMVDVDEFANYMAAQLYLGGDDWPGNNCKAFKGHDGKFHVVLFDIDQALRYDRGSLNRITYAGEPLMVIFRNMLQNATFRKLFIDSYCLFGGSVMEPTRCHAIIDRISRQMNPALALEGLSTEPTASYMKQVLTSSRQETMISALQQWSPVRLSSLTAQQVTLRTNTPSARLQVNGIPVPTNSFSGALFPPVVLTASAPEGYVFRGWQDGDGHVYSTSESFDISRQGDYQLTAVYEPLTTDADLLSAIAVPVKVNEVSAGNTVFVSEEWKRSDWLELYNNTDETLDFDGLFVSDDINQPYKYQIRKSATQSTRVPARGRFIVWADNAPQLSAAPAQQHASFKLSNADGQVVLVTSSDDFVNNNADYFSRHPGLKAFIDGLTYTAHRGDQSVGRYPDGGTDFYQMWRPTIERRNTLLTADRKVGEDVSLMSLLPDGFSLELAKGWNWTSHPLYSPVSTADLPAQVRRIVGQQQECMRNGEQGLSGTLHSLEAGQLYKVQATKDVIYQSTGSFCPSNMPIALRPGWNWVGYPVNGTQTLQAALADYLAEEGDNIVGQHGFATYDGNAWVGSLTTLETGRGYMLYTRQAKTLCFRSPQVAVNMSRRAAPRSSSSAAEPLRQYPNVMGIIARLADTPSPSSFLLPPSSFTLLAYSNGELRGQGEWIGDEAFITVYGQGGEALTYQAVDNESGAVYAVRETDAFASGVLGSLQQPRLLTLGECTGVSTQLSAVPARPSSASVVGFYSLSGVLVSRSAAALPQGTYILRYADGTHRKVQIQ